MSTRANVLRRSDGLFREVFWERVKGSGIEGRELLVDAAAAALVLQPKKLDCLVTLNLYGDILSDEAAALVGGLGFAPSVNMGERFALFEPTHGSAPDIAGQDRANPDRGHPLGGHDAPLPGHGPQGRTGGGLGHPRRWTRASEPGTPAGTWGPGTSRQTSLKS